MWSDVNGSVPWEEMLGIHVLPVPEFYAELDRYMRSLDPTWVEEGWQAQAAEERGRLGSLLGEGAGRRLLDCSCGDGRQAIPLAELGWAVTGSDVTAESLERAQRHAEERGLAIGFRPCDMRQLDQCFPAEFDRVISCMALDNLIEDGGIQEALRGMDHVLKPGGLCYIRLRDMGNVMSERPRYEFREERQLLHGRVIRLEDWVFESETQAICVYVFLHEDRRRQGWAWDVRTLAWRRRALGKAELAALLEKAGFRQVTFLPQPSPWHPYEVLATKPSSGIAEQ